MQNQQQKHHQHQSIPPHAQLFEIATGFMRSQTLYAAAELGIADLLKDGEKSVDELARLTQTHSESLYRLLRALSSIGVFAESENRRFQLTPMASAIQCDDPQSLRSYIRLLGDPSWWRPWGNLLYSLRSGEPAFDRVFETDYQTHLEHHPDLYEVFQDCMTRVSRIHNQAVVQAYDFSAHHNIIDVGGGQGSLLKTILEASPDSNGVLFDLPQVVEHADTSLKAVGGDFFQNVPAEGDVYVLKQVIHDWDDDRAVQILKNCRRVMHDQAVLLIIEAVLDSPADPVNLFFDLHMLVTAPGGRERSKPEFEALLHQAGLKGIDMIATRSSFSVIKAVKSK